MTSRADILFPPPTLDVDFSEPAENAVHPPRPPPGRTLPHSIEAEELLLSCILLDGPDVLARCAESGITDASFYETKYGIVFSHLSALHAAGKPVAIDTLAEELKTSRELSTVGGYAFLVQISSKAPTTAQAAYFIEKVREQALLRQLIRSATGIVESAYNYSGGIEDHLTSARRMLETVTEPSSASISARKFNPAAEPPRERVIYSAAGVPICTAGNLTNIVALPGSGKSATVGALLAATFVSATASIDLLGFSGPNYDGAAVLHFDTEQSAVHYDRNLRRALLRSGLTAFPPWFHSYHLTGLAPQDARHAVESTISRFGRRGKIHSVHIDGWADLVLSPNDERECSPFVIRMHDLSIRHDTAILGVMHLNPITKASDVTKSRGHLGSYLDRKAETVLKLELDQDDRTSVQTTKQRGAPLKKGKLSFKWSDEHQMHRSCSAPPKVDSARSKSSAAPTIDAIWAFIPGPGQSPIPQAALWRYAKGAGTMTEAQFKELLSSSVKDGMIERIGDPNVGLTYRRQL